MRQFISFKLLLVASILIFSCSPARYNSYGNQISKPNILFIAIDDLRPELGAYGNKYMKTPHMDQLAGEGRLFLNHYANIPTCGASRYSMMRGRYPKTTGDLSNAAFEHNTAGKPRQPLPESLVEQFRRNGYTTIGIGKVSHAADGRVYGYNEPVSDVMELPNSWNQFLFDHGKWGTGWNAFFGYADGTNRQTHNGNVKPYESADVDDTGYPDGLSATLAVDQLNQLKNNKQPFFLAVGFFKPHLPFVSPKKYWDLYDENSLPVSPSKEMPEGSSPADFHNSGEFNFYKKGEEHPSLKSPVSDAYARKLRHAYFAATSYVDAQVGKVLDALKKNGLDKNTIVVLWGDHGWHLGDHMVWGKHTLAEYALRSAFIMKVPHMKSAGKPTAQVIQSADIYPTLLELAGLPQPYPLDGKSFVTLLKNPSFNRDGVAYGYFNNGITMRTGRYRITKYFRKQKPHIELYDYQNDPAETKNIANENPEIVERLLPLLQKGNTGLYN